MLLQQGSEQTDQRQWMMVHRWMLIDPMQANWLLQWWWMMMLPNANELSPAVMVDEPNERDCAPFAVEDKPMAIAFAAAV